MLLALPLRTPLNPYDEGLALVGGLRVLRGDVPFKDFAAVYPPAESYLLAAAFRLAGASVGVERAVDLVVRALIVFVLYAITVHTGGSRWRGAVLSLIAALLLAQAGFPGYTTFPALLGAFGATWAFLKYQRGGAGWLVVSGVAAGLSTGFSLDVGVVAIATMAAGIVMSYAAARPLRPNAFRRDVLLLAVGASAVVLPFWAYVAAQAGAEQVWGQLWSHIVIFRDTRSLPYPPLLSGVFAWPQCGVSMGCLDETWGTWARFYLPQLVLLGLTGHVIHARRRDTPESLTTCVVLGLIAAGLYMKALSRYDAIHALPAFLGLLPVFAVLAAWRPRGSQNSLMVVAVAILGSVFVVLPTATLVRVVSAHPPNRCYSDRPIASCVPLWDGQDQVLTALDARVPSTSPVFIGLQRHDRVFANDISLYFLAQRPIPTRHHEMDPGVVDTESVQREIIDELQRASVEWLVLLDYPDSTEPNASSRRSTADVLDRFIRSHYRPLAQIARYELWGRQSDRERSMRASPRTTVLPMP